jgi:hypothetical protein
MARASAAALIDTSLADELEHAHSITAELAAAPCVLRRRRHGDRSKRRVACTPLHRSTTTSSVPSRFNSAIATANGMRLVS